jgi:long-chain fatty acid transport protein
MEAIHMRYVILSSFLILSCLSSCYAAGLRINLENSADLGNAFAGGAALTEDASVNAFNPAGLSFVHRQQVVVSGVGVLSHTHFNGTVTAPSQIPGGFPGYLNTGSARSNSNGFIPAFYYMYPFNSQWDLGISVNTPHGLGLDYGENSLTRYSLVNAHQSGINIGPSISYRITPQLAVGAGPDFQYYSLDAAIKTNTAVAFLNTIDSRSKVDAHGWGYGAHAGLLYAPTDKTHIGFAYRSQIAHRLSGKSTYESGTLAIDVPSAQSDNYKTSFTFPPIIMLSTYQVLTEQLALLGSIDYTLWNRFNTLHQYNVAQPGTPININIPEKFSNTWHAAVAMNYLATHQWLLRFGMGYDQDAGNTNYRSIKFPHGNVIALGLGIRYIPSKTIAIDGGYLHSFIQSVHTNTTSVQTGVNINGKLQTYADTLGIQLTWNIA